ncbi:MAG: NFACT RNA binding domain-containing protein [Oscillospiraceae bacterium]
MPLDAICLRAVVEELRPRIVGARIDKVQQPVRDQIVLLLRGNLRLLLGAGANAPRLQLTELLRDNPAAPPMFCMLLRKHLIGGRIVEISQPGLERLAELTIEITDELGQPGVRRLILEAMGRHANLILADGEGHIIDCLRRVDMEMSPQRQILPGLFYHLPPAPEGKLPLTEASADTLTALLRTANPETRVDGFLLDHFFGISPLIARELAVTACGDCETRLLALDEAGEKRLLSAVKAQLDTVNANCFTPTCLQRDGKPMDFTYQPIRQYGDTVDCSAYDSFSHLLDDFYEIRERQERARQRGQNLLRLTTNARDRLTRKLALQEKEYEGTQEREGLRIRGDLLTANLYRMEKGAVSFLAENFYDPEGGTLPIALDPLLTPQQNAAKYYKKYTKAKTAQRYLTEQIQRGQREKIYLESVLEELREAETETDFTEIRSELREAGYLKQTPEKKGLKRPSRPREFRSTAGLRILIGRNNRQNDVLTCKDADRRDIWLHTQKIHGAHVILCTEGGVADEASLAEAALLAAYYSQAREGSRVPVDYTPVKYVKKPAGARPGMVVYETYQTILVTPNEETVKELLVKK